MHGEDSKLDDKTALLAVTGRGLSASGSITSHSSPNGCHALSLPNSSWHYEG